MQSLKKILFLICSVTILAGCASGRTAFDKAVKFEQSGDLDQAVMKYAEAAAENPEIKEYRLNLLNASSKAAILHVKRGDVALEAKNYDEALQEYQTASLLDPSEERARQQADMVKRLKMAQVLFKEGEALEASNKSRDALRSYRKSLELDPGHLQAKERVDQIIKAKPTKLGNFELNLKSNKPITLKFKDAKIKDVFNIITKLSGINFIFDDAVKDVNFSIYLENATFQQALEVITELNKLGKKVLNESTVIIFPRNAEKNKQYEELYLQTFYLNKIDAKKAINLLRTMMQIKKIYVNEELNALVIRDTPDVVELAGKILEANDIPDSEVVLEVEVIELSKANAEQLGFMLSRYAISVQGAQNNNAPFAETLGASPPTLPTANLLQLFAWRQFSGFLTVPNATFNFGKTLANGETLSNPKIRVKNREKAKFNVGTRVPITTTSSPVGGGVNVNVQYVDVGVKLNAEPTIQLNNEISIKLGMEVSSILSRDSSSGTSVVTIGTRNLDTVLSLKDGETSIIGGLIQDARNKGRQKIAFLGEIPLIGSLFSNSDTRNDKTELILAITPRIVRSMTVPSQSAAAFWSGKEDEPSTTKLYSSFIQDEVGQLDDAPQAGPDVASAHAPEEAVSGSPVDQERRRRRPSPDQPAVQPAPTSKVPQVTQVVPQTQAVPAGVQPVPLQPPPSQQPAQPAPVPPSQQAPATPAPGAPVAKPAPTERPAESQSKKVYLQMNNPASISLKDEIRVEVMTMANNVNRAVISIDFDPALLDYTGAAEGTFFKVDGQPSSFTPKVDRATGKLDIIFAKPGDLAVSGSGPLVTLTFKAKGKGSINLRSGRFDFYSPGGNLLETNVHGGTIEIK